MLLAAASLTDYGSRVAALPLPHIAAAYIADSVLTDAECTF
jgi:hypothetical protein